MALTDARMRRTARPRHRLAVLLGLTLAAASCAPPPLPPAPPPAPPARPLPPAGYDGRRDSLDSVDPGVLRGRRIMLDPGHGGFFPGTRGVNGLTEKEVNLGVALALRDLLVAAGAEVRLTRDTDRDFLTPADSSLRADLAERARLNREWGPDLFVSIHHNADARGRNDVNEVQTYFPVGDDGVAYDLGQDVHRSFTRNLGITPARLIPGNFYVIRTSDAPALLTEGSYLTYPPTEARLRDPAAQRLEAEAIYLGIARTFMRRAPRLTAFEALDDAGRADTSFRAVPRLVARVEGAFDEVRVRVNGVAVPVVARGGVVEATPGPLAGGTHEATLTARLATEGAARTRRLRFHLTKAPAHLEATMHGSPLAHDRTVVAAEVRVLDADRLPVPDSFRVRVSSEPRGVFVPAETTVHAVDGRALAYLRRARNVSARLASHASLVARLVPASGVAAARLPLADLRATTRTAFVRVMPNDTALALPDARRPAWLDRNGFVALPVRANEPVAPPLPAGFRHHDADTLWPPRVVAIANGALHGRRIVLDPEGGGDDAAGMGPGGSRGSALNLETARALAGMLSAAGAEVRLTRENEQAMSELQRVQVAEGFGASHYLRIGHANGGATAGHYFSSGAGRRWGQRLAAVHDSLGLPPLRVVESAQYTIAQVSAVGLHAVPARVDSSEQALLAPGRLRAQAYAMFLALALELSPAGTTWPLDSLAVRDADDRPLAGVPVRLGGGLVLSTGADGWVRFARSEPGPLEIVVQDARAPLRAVLREDERGRVLRAPR